MLVLYVPKCQEKVMPRCSMRIFYEYSICICPKIKNDVTPSYEYFNVRIYPAEKGLEKKLTSFDS